MTNWIPSFITQDLTRAKDFYRNFSAGRSATYRIPSFTNEQLSPTGGMMIPPISGDLNSLWIPYIVTDDITAGPRKHGVSAPPSIAR